MEYGGGQADGSRIARNRAPSPMRADIERWIEDYPKATGFVARLYAEERGTITVEAGQIVAEAANLEADAEQ